MSVSALEPASRLQAALEVAGLGIPVVPVHYPVAVAGARGTGCSCGRGGCATPARHVALGVGPVDATTYPRQLRRWWQGEGPWNVAAVAGRCVDVLALSCPRPAAEVAAWLAAHRVVPGPVIDLGGRVVFLTTVRRGPTGQRRRAGSGWLERVCHGELVVLPPSRLVDSRSPEWLAGPQLPFADEGLLWRALAELPEAGELAALAMANEHRQEGSA